MPGDEFQFVPGEGAVRAVVGGPVGRPLGDHPAAVGGQVPASLAGRRGPRTWPRRSAGRPSDPALGVRRLDLFDEGVGGAGVERHLRTFPSRSTLSLPSTARVMSYRKQSPGRTSSASENLWAGAAAAAAARANSPRQARRRVMRGPRREVATAPGNTRGGGGGQGGGTPEARPIAFGRNASPAAAATPEYPPAANTLQPAARGAR